MKICKKCGVQKQKSEFYIFNKKTGQTINRCKTCHKIYSLEWQSKNPDSMKRAWTKGNKKKNKGRNCPICATFFKAKDSRKGCSLMCRFKLAHIKTENGCWDWIMGKGGKLNTRHGPSQYGHMWINKKCFPAHRVSWELHKGFIPEKMMILHKCDRPICVNPDHLFLGSHQDNMVDMNKKGRGNLGRNHFRKYSKEICIQAINLRSKGMTFKEISNTLAIKESACKFICKRPHRLR